MKKPCPEDPEKCECRICWLFLHHSDYRALWDGVGPAIAEPPSVSLRIARAKVECLHLGDPLETAASCGCGSGGILRSCGIHGRCRRFGIATDVQLCGNCADYSAKLPAIALDSRTE